ncbi:ABC transporter ATP-binding protein [Candidatus Uhrbacteria bacterium]|nr:ABC transporter ATP-binding protein [Candidatus Uhrbacteria bacterium]
MKSSALPHLIRVILSGFKRYKKKLAVLVLLGIFGALLEGVGINALIPLLGIVLQDASIQANFITENITDFFSFLHIALTVKNLFLFISTLFVLKAGLLFLFHYINARITAAYEYTERSALFKKLLQADWLFLTHQKIGYLDQVMTSDIATSTALLKNSSNAILAITNLIIYSLIALSISWSVTLTALTGGAVFFFAFKPIYRKTASISRTFTENNKRIAHMINQTLIGIKSFKTRATPSLVIDSSDDIFRALKMARIKLFVYSGLGTIFSQPAIVIFVLIIFALVYKLSNFQFSAFAVTMYLVHQIFKNIEAIQDKVQKISDQIPHLESNLHYRSLAETHKEYPSGQNPFLFQKELICQHIRFNYSEEKQTLSEITFRVKKGEAVGIIGPSGSGKTTLVDLLLRLITPQAGEITIDQQPIQEIDVNQWRKKVAYVPQDLFLVRGTIRQNIRFYDETVSDEDVAWAVSLAHVDEFVQTLKDGLDTEIGEFGAGLSTGQRQRVVLARALACRPELLILDEATSALDNDSEKRIHETIRSLKGTVTIIMVTHRLSLLSTADRVLAMTDGCIGEEGTPQELLQNSNSYFSRMSVLE